MSKLSEAQERLDDMTAEREQCYDDMVKLIAAARREHEDHHYGVFAWCDRPVCVIARELDGTYVP